MIAMRAMMNLILAALLPIQAPSASPQAPASRKSPNFEVLSREANRAREEGRSDDAIGWYRQGLALKPNWDEGLWYLGTLLYDKEQYSDARDLLRRFVSRDPETGPGWALLGMSEFRTREYSRALDHLQRSRSLGLGDRKEMAQSVAYFAAASLTRLEQYDDGMDLLFEIVNAGRCDSEVMEAAGLAVLRMPLVPSEIPPDRREMIRAAGAAFCAVQMGQREDAEKQFRTLAEIYPNEPGVHYLFGTFLADVRTDDAIRELKRELEISPFHVLTRLRLADIYLKQQQPDGALPLTEEAVKLAPNEASPHMMYGEALAANRELARAIQELETARERAPDVGRIHADLLRAYSAAGRTADANREKDALERLRRPGTEQ
jgi:tetratricopeptide (TPR) repeat protein